jgi:nickel-dependent lactate racemase
MTGAMPIVERGGTIVLAASLSQGIGSPEFQQRLIDSRYVTRLATADEPVAESCEMDEWQLVMFAKVARHCRVKVVTDGLSAEVLRKCHVEPAPTVETAVTDALAEYGPAARVAVIPKGPYVLPYVA